MPATSPGISTTDSEQLQRLGERIRRARKLQRVSAVAAAEAAGLSRVTLHRIERGEPSVAIASWLAVASALGLTLQFVGAKAALESERLPERILLADYSQLKQLAWQLHGVDELSPREALDLYERNWRHVDRKSMTQSEIDLIDALSTKLSGARLLV